MANFIKALARWKEVIFITVLIKIILFFLPYILLSQTTNFTFSWIRWDGPHYIDIAQNWYQTMGDPANFIVFYPLYPILIKILNYITRDFSVSALIIPFVFSFSASIFLFELTLLDFNRKTALLSIWFLNIFPTSYFLQASYNESIFLTVSLSTIYFYRQKKYIVSSFIGILSTLTRVNGLLLLPLLILEMKKDKKSLLTIFILPIGFLIYLLINFFTFGEFFYFTKPLLSNWGKKLEWPWIGLNNLMSFINTQTGHYYYLFWGEIISILLIVFFTIFAFLKLRKSYGVYMLINLLLFTSTNFIMSTPRYALSLFPIYICLGLIKNRLLLIILSTISLILLFILSTYYIQGKWAY